jgi:hypothetical protein
MTRRSTAVVVLIGVGLLQLWDSRVFDAGLPAIAIALTGLLLPVLALAFTERVDVRIGSVALCAVLLLSAKVVAPHPLPAIGVIAVIAAAANGLAMMPRRA